jgi:prefoldin subunit 5
MPSALATPSSTTPSTSNNANNNIITSFRTNEYETLLEQKLIPLYEQKQKLIKNYENQIREFVPLQHKINDIIQHIYIQEGLSTVESSSSSLSVPTSSSSSSLQRRSSMNEDYPMLIDVGQGYRIPVAISHPSLETTTISIDIGCNIFIEMKLIEALQYIQEEIRDLET